MDDHLSPKIPDKYLTVRKESSDKETKLWNTETMHQENRLILKNIFWEFDLSLLDFSKYKNFVIERVLEKGRVEHLKLLFKIYSFSEVESVVESSQNLSEKTRNFWRLFFQYALT